MTIIQLSISNAVLSDLKGFQMVKLKDQMIMESGFEIRKIKIKGKLNEKSIF
jgi:hypothetical protein